MSNIFFRLELKKRDLPNHDESLMKNVNISVHLAFDIKESMNIKNQ